MKILPVSKVNFKNIKKQNNSSIFENNTSAGNNYHSGNKHLSVFLATLLLPTIITGPSYSNNKEIEKSANQRISEIVNLEKQQSEYKFDEIENEDIRSYLESLANQQESDISRLSELNFKLAEIPKDIREVIIKGNGGDGKDNMSIDELAEMYKSSMNPKDKKHQSGQAKIAQAFTIYQNKVILDTVKENQELLNSLLSNFKDDISELSPKEIIENFAYNMGVINKCKSSVPEIKNQYEKWADPNCPWVTRGFRRLQDFMEFMYKMKNFIKEDANTIETIDMKNVNLLADRLNISNDSSESPTKLEELEEWCANVTYINTNIEHFKSTLLSEKELKDGFFESLSASIENMIINSKLYEKHIMKKLKNKNLQIVK